MQANTHILKVGATTLARGAAAGYIVKREKLQQQGACSSR
jgi:hypothetical protein